MYAWIIAHNLGIFLIIAPLVLLAWSVIIIEEKNRKNSSQKGLTNTKSVLYYKCKEIKENKDETV